MPHKSDESVGSGRKFAFNATPEVKNIIEEAEKDFGLSMTNAINKLIVAGVAPFWHDMYEKAAEKRAKALARKNRNLNALNNKPHERTDEAKRNLDGGR